MANFEAKESSMAEELKNFNEKLQESLQTAPTNIEKDMSDHESSQQSSLFHSSPKQSIKLVAKEMEKEDNSASKSEQVQHFQGKRASIEKAGKKVTFLEELKVKEKEETVKPLPDKQETEKEAAFKSAELPNVVADVSLRVPNETVLTLKTNDDAKEHVVLKESKALEAAQSSSNLQFESTKNLSEEIKGSSKTAKSSNDRNRKTAIVVSDSKQVETTKIHVPIESTTLAVSQKDIVPLTHYEQEEAKHLSSVKGEKSIELPKYESQSCSNLKVEKPIKVSVTTENEVTKNTELSTPLPGSKDVLMDETESVMISTSTLEEVSPALVNEKSRANTVDSSDNTVLPKEEMTSSLTITSEESACLEIENTPKEHAEKNQMDSFKTTSSEVVMVEDGVKPLKSDEKQKVFASEKSESNVTVSMKEPQMYLSVDKLEEKTKLQPEASTANYEPNFSKVIEETKVPELAVQEQFSEAASDNAIISMNESFPMMNKEIIPEQAIMMKKALEDYVADQADLKVKPNLAALNEQISNLGAVESIKEANDVPKRATRSRENSIPCIDHQRAVIDQTQPLEDQPKLQESSHSRELSLPRLQEEVVRGDTVKSISSRNKSKSSKVKSTRQPSQTREQGQVTRVESAKAMGNSLDSDTRGRAKLKNTSSKLSSSKELKKSVRSLSLGKNESSITKGEVCEDFKSVEIPKETPFHELHSSEGFEVVASHKVEDASSISESNNYTEAKSEPKRQSLNTIEREGQPIIEQSDALNNNHIPQTSTANEGESSPMSEVLVDVPIPLDGEKGVPEKDTPKSLSEVILPFQATSNEVNIPLDVATSKVTKSGKSRKIDAISLHDDYKQVATTNENRISGTHRNESSLENQQAEMIAPDQYPTVLNDTIAVDNVSKLSEVSISSFEPVDSLEAPNLPTVVRQSETLQSLGEQLGTPDLQEVEVRLVKQEAIQTNDVNTSLSTTILETNKVKKEELTKKLEEKNKTDESVEVSLPVMTEQLKFVAPIESKQLPIAKIDPNQPHQNIEIEHLGSTAVFQSTSKASAKMNFEQESQTSTVEENVNVESAKTHHKKKATKGKPKRDHSIPRTDEITVSEDIQQKTNIEAKREKSNTVNIETTDHKSVEETLTEYNTEEFEVHPPENSLNDFQVIESTAHVVENLTIDDSNLLFQTEIGSEKQPTIQKDHSISHEETNIVSDETVAALSKPHTTSQIATPNSLESSQVVIDTQILTEATQSEPRHKSSIAVAQASNEERDSIHRIDTQTVAEVATPLDISLTSTGQAEVTAEEQFSTTIQINQEPQQNTKNLSTNIPLEESIINLVNTQNFPSECSVVPELQTVANINQTSKEQGMASKAMEMSQPCEIQTTLTEDIAMAEQNKQLGLASASKSLVEQHEVVSNITQHQSSEIPYISESPKTQSIIPLSEASLRHDSKSDETIQHEVKYNLKPKQAKRKKLKQKGIEADIEQVTILGSSKDMDDNSKAKGSLKTEENILMEQEEPMVLENLNNKKVCR